MQTKFKITRHSLKEDGVRSSQQARDRAEQEISDLHETYVLTESTIHADGSAITCFWVKPEDPLLLDSEGSEIKGVGPYLPGVI